MQDPSGEPIQCAEIPGLPRPARSVECSCWPAIHHPSKVRPCSQVCSDGTSCIPQHLREDTTKRLMVQCPLSYLSTTSM
jgi:hypothetical protein